MVVVGKKGRPILLLGDEHAQYEAHPLCQCRRNIVDARLHRSLIHRVRRFARSNRLAVGITR